MAKRATNILLLLLVLLIAGASTQSLVCQSRCTAVAGSRSCHASATPTDLPEDAPSRHCTHGQHHHHLDKLNLGPANHSCDSSCVQSVVLAPGELHHPVNRSDSPGQTVIASAPNTAATTLHRITTVHVPPGRSSSFDPLTVRLRL